RVAFVSSASNLVAGDHNGVADVFLTGPDGTVSRVSVAADGGDANGPSSNPDLSADGRFVAFESAASNLVAGDTNQDTDVFLRDRRRHTTVLVSASSLNVQGNNDSFSPLISADGRIVAFQSLATNMAPGDGPREDVFVRDLEQRTTSVVGVADDGSPRAAELVPQLLQRPALSADGRIAAFSSTAPNLVAGDTNGREDVFLRLLDAPQTDLVSKQPGRRPVVDLK